MQAETLNRVCSWPRVRIIRGVLRTDCPEKDCKKEKECECLSQAVCGPATMMGTGRQKGQSQGGHRS